MKLFILVIILSTFSLTCFGGIKDLLWDDEQIDNIIMADPYDNPKKVVTKLMQNLIEDINSSNFELNEMKLNELAKKNTHIYKEFNMLLSELFTHYLSVAFYNFKDSEKSEIATYIIDENLFGNYEVKYDFGFELVGHIYYLSNISKNSGFSLKPEYRDFYERLTNNYEYEDIDWNEKLYDIPYLVQNLFEDRNGDLNPPWESPGLANYIYYDFWRYQDLPLFADVHSINKLYFYKFLRSGFEKYLKRKLFDSISQNKKDIAINYKNLVRIIISILESQAPQVPEEGPYEADHHQFKTPIVEQSSQRMALRPVIYLGVDQKTRYLVLLPEKFIEFRDPKFLSIARKVCLDKMTKAKADIAETGRGILSLLPNGLLAKPMNNQSIISWVKLNITDVKQMNLNGCQANIATIGGQEYIIGSQITGVL